MSQRNVEIVRGALEAFERGDTERALAMAHPELVSTRVHPDNAVFHGHAGFLRLMADWVEGFTDWSFRSDDYIDAGDQVVVRLHQSARGASSDVPVEGDYWVVYAVADGKITSLDIYSDQSQALEAVGLAE